MIVLYYIANNIQSRLVCNGNREIRFNAHASDTAHFGKTVSDELRPKASRISIRPPYWVPYPEMVTPDYQRDLTIRLAGVADPNNPTATHIPSITFCSGRTW